MQTSRTAFRMVLAATAVLLAVPVLAAEGQEAPKEMSAEEKAIMEAYAKAAAPGEHHEIHKKMAGTWVTTVTWWNEPGAPPERSTGTATVQPMMDNRYVHEEVKGTMQGQPFHGAGLSGYDNVTKKHWSIWVDNMSTGMMSSWGVCEPGHKVINAQGESPDPISGKMMPFRSVTRREGDDRVVYEMYGRAKDDHEFKQLEVVYTRK